MDDQIIGSQAFDNEAEVWYPWAMNQLMPLAYMTVIDDDAPHRDLAPVHHVCEACAKKKAGGDIAAYNQARGFDWRGAWIDAPEDQDDYEDFQERNGLVVGDPIYVLFGEGLTINQMLVMHPVHIAQELGCDPDELTITEQPDFRDHECECARCGAVCVTIDGTHIAANP